jgi:dolichol-phosphate mannosyltransferase
MIVVKLVDEIRIAMKDCEEEYEIILVDDGSPDESWKEIERICAKSIDVVGIKLSRNFGQHNAITAGLVQAKGEWVIVMDCDLQDRPQEIPRLYAKALEGFDLVLAERAIRQDNLIKRWSSRLFYKIFSFLTGTEQNHRVANFGIYQKKVIKSILEMKDYIRYFPTMTQWVGFNKASIEVSHGERGEGESSYSWGTLIRLAFHNIIAFSDKVLHLTVSLGVLISGVSFLIGLYNIILYFRGDIEVLGFTSLIVSIWFLSGLIIFILGIIGVYLGKAFDQVKSRPVYIIDKVLNA